MTGRNNGVRRDGYLRAIIMHAWFAMLGGSTSHRSLASLVKPDSLSLVTLS